ncbi:Crp/Fnr family transcriptional regulator [Thermoflavimicrobium dichotomicum]|uniref:cAMP-binding domain of CRP or a regulatory subunit of cAMP-dependent protein kinases n=1 Tax=Thermoflavimicrobium dichotomicum TaxID=46223 RepID=A0A1I3NPH2_9BACL|nr:Crp/Fnr family transcriptional regulator [Thermoflavimicrobium dichotomicum]SFJ10676.1 cAMP-binding domain of CRP or a regulatory subunit of cAMP-dependent protein kinases [Thermoflavimicrobium dichotomicum]
MILHKGEVLFIQGETGGLYKLKSGLLKVVRLQEDGDCVLMNLLVPGEIFPHHSLFSPKPYFATVSAVITSEVEMIHTEEWYKEVKENPAKQYELARLLEHYLVRMQERVSLTTVPASKRIPLFRKWLQKYCPNQPIEELLTQEEIGQFLGMSRETVNRYLRKLK